MSKRADVHRPSIIQPDDYEFVAIECMRIDDLGSCLALADERARFRAHKERTGGDYARHEHGGNCHICGSVNAIYTVLFYHAPSNTYVRTGQDCADKLDSGFEHRFRRVKDAVTAARESRAGKLKAQGVLQEEGLGGAWDIFTATDRQGFAYEEGTITDIVEKLVRYGSISEAQTNFLRKLLDQIPRRAQIAAERAAEREAAKPAPAGRVRGEFDVVSVKDFENDFGTRFVMTIKHVTDGWLAWGTAPAGVNKGDRITLAATFGPSEKDTKFAFFKRPTVIASKSPEAV